MRRALWGTLTVLLLAALIGAGLFLRWRLWDWTMHVRFFPDIQNGYNWGREVDRVGYLNLYDILGKPERGKRYIDYAPLRLGVMSAWVQWLKAKELPLTEYLTDDAQLTRAYHAPLLNFNMTMEALAACAAALLVWHVRGRSAGPAGHDRWTSLWMALAAAVFVWLNPASTYEAHAWPQWDVWPMPFFLFALYCGLRRWWLVAGLLIGAGSMLKGQILTVGWIVPLWALCMGDWRGSIRLVIAAYTAIMLVGSPWVFSAYDAATKLRVIHTAAIGITVLAVLAAALIPRRFSPAIICGVLAVCLLVSMKYLGGTDYWLQSSFGVGTWNYHRMFMGPTSNLPAILQFRWGWEEIDEVMFTLPALVYRNSLGEEGFRIGGAITMRTLLLSIFFTLSAICAARAAFLDRRNDPRMLVALTLPWLFFFVFPCQIHERYLVFVAMCSATWIVCGPGTTLMGVLLSVVGAAHVIHCCLGVSTASPRRWERVKEWPFPQIRQWLDGTHPGIGWLLLLASAVLLYNIFMPARRPAAIEPEGTEPIA